MRKDGEGRAGDGDRRKIHYQLEVDVLRTNFRPARLITGHREKRIGVTPSQQSKEKRGSQRTSRMKKNISLPSEYQNRPPVREGRHERERGKIEDGEGEGKRKKKTIQGLSYSFFKRQMVCGPVVVETAQ